MKLFHALIILFFLNSCSFDNKSGVWKNTNISNDKISNQFRGFESLSSSHETFNKIISIDKKFIFKKTENVNPGKWIDKYYNDSNNLENFEFNYMNKLIFKGKKLSKYNLNKTLLLEENNIITSDQRGNLIIFSINENKILSKYNFYKKQYKKTIKNLNLIIENNVIYLSDNLGYLYAYNYKNKKLLWAKNYKIPFRSNLKLFRNKLIAINQNNTLFFFNKNNGEVLSSIPTEEVPIKNQFISNISLSERFTFFINTYGTLYSVESDSMQIKWFLNLNQSKNFDEKNMFTGSEIIYQNGKILVLSNKFTYVINSNNGSIIYKYNFSSSIKPIILNNYVFILSNNTLLISFNLDNGNIIYSYDINSLIANFLNDKKNKIKPKNIIVANNNLFIVLENSYFLRVRLDGTIKEISRLPNKIVSHPIFINKSMIYLNNKNKISIIN